MLTRWCSRNSRDLGVVIGAASYPSVLHTLGYWAQKKKPAIPPLSSRTPSSSGISEDDTSYVINYEFAHTACCLPESSFPTSPNNSSRVDRKSTRLNSSHLGISYAVF